MQPIDNSDLAWLIIADFLLDQNKIAQSEELNREGDSDHNYIGQVGSNVGSAAIGAGSRGWVGGIADISVSKSRK